MTNILSDLRIRILEKVARGEPADATLRALCTSVEALVPGAVVGVTMLDRAARNFEQVIFPSVPKSFSERLEGAQVADRPGSCALAVYQGSAVVSDDIANDPRFQDGWKALSLDHGISAIQSHPVTAENGLSYGTLVVAFAKPRRLDDKEEEAVRTAVGLASIALARHRADRQQELLIGELHHRTRNLFSAIGAVVYSTLKGHPDAKDFRKVFDGRLRALAHAHSLVVESTDADLRVLLTEVLAPYSMTHRIEMSGPVFILASDAAVAFSLATHELATNATKYGALSSSVGALRVTWSVARDQAGETMFEMEWKESGGPTVSKPTKGGFGQFAIEQSMASTVDGAVSLDFAPSGLVCTIRAPVSARLGSLSN